MQKFRKERVARMLNVMREGLRLDYEGKGLLSFVSNECGSHGGDNVGLARRSLLTSVKPTRVKPVRKQCSFTPPQTESVGLNKMKNIRKITGTCFCQIVFVMSKQCGTALAALIL